MRLWLQGPLQYPIQNVNIIFALDVDKKLFMDCHVAIIALLKAVAFKEVEEGTTDFFHVITAEFCFLLSLLTVNLLKNS
jgi:hypothetical protein